MFEIGNSLREARLRQRIDFPELEQATKIRAKYLRALEQEQFEVLPAQTYVRGFLRSYAEYLGLDGQLYVDEYTSRFVAGEEGDRPVRPRRSSARPRQHRRVETSVLLAALAAIALLTGLVIAAWKFGGGSSQPAIPNLSQGPVKKSRPAAVAPRRQGAKARLLVRAVYGTSLLEVHAGSASGKLLYHGTLERGQRQRFVGKRLWINVGTPENLLLKLNGRAVALAGGSPLVVIVTARAIRAAGGPS